MNALERLLVVEDLPAWDPALRSRTRLRSAPTRHFVDPSLAAVALGATAIRLRGDVNTLGFLFESLVVRDLRIYSQPLGADVYHYRDEAGLEADAVVQLRDGAWAAFEVKLGHGSVDAAAASLLKLRAKVDPASSGPPVFLAVITGWGSLAYTRPDGVAVIPIGALGA
jgi:predicted AAA+ superfamily ATPase